MQRLETHNQNAEMKEVAYQRLDPPFPEVIDTPLADILLPHDSWFTRNVLYRLAWGGCFLGSFVTMGFVTLKALFQLLTLRPLQALKTFFIGNAACLGTAALSLISLFAPSLIQQVAQDLLFPSFKNNAHAAQIHAQLYTSLIDGDKDNIEIVETLGPIESQKHFIHCLGVSSCCQGAGVQEVVANAKIHFDRHGVSFNYPGTTRNEYRSRSKTDLVNAGIAVVYELAKRNCWSNEEIGRNVQLYGLSLGGAVALQVAKHFKIRHGIDIHVIADRAFSSSNNVAAAHLNRHTHIPFACGKVLSSAVTYGSGNWNMDSVAACKHIRKLHYFNLGHAEEKQQPVRKSWLQRLCEFIGIGRRFYRPLEKLCHVRKFSQDADLMIPDGSTLAEAMEDCSTKSMLASLNTDRRAHLVYPNPLLPNRLANHNAQFRDLKTENNGSTVKLFRHVVTCHDEQSAPSPQPSPAL